MILHCNKSSNNDITAIKMDANNNVTITQLINSYVLNIVGNTKIPNGTIREIDSQYFIIGNSLFKIDQQSIQFIEELKGILYGNSNMSLICTSNNLIISKQFKVIKQISITDVLPIDRIDYCVVGINSIIILIHCSIFCFDLSMQLQHILQCDDEVHNIVFINDYGYIGITYYCNNILNISDIKTNKQITSYQIKYNKCITTDITLNYSPYKLNLLLDIDNQQLHLILCSNQSYGQITLHYRCMMIVGLSDIVLLQDSILIKYSQMGLIQLHSNSVVNDQQYLEQLNIDTVYCDFDILSNIPQYCTYYGGYIYEIDNNGIVNIFKLSDKCQQNIFKMKQNVHPYSVLNVHVVADRIVIYCKVSNMYHLMMYTLTYQLLTDYVFDTTYDNVIYCPYYSGILFWEADTKYVDTEPTNNLILQVDAIEQTNFLLVDLQTKQYKNKIEGQQSYIMQGKSLKCGFMLPYIAHKITNVQSNYFAIQTVDQIKIVQVNNNPYVLHNCFEFGVLNERLITFKNSLPLEDLERLPILKSAQPQQNILYCELIGNNGIIQTVYSLKWVELNYQQYSVALRTINMQNKVNIQKILYYNVGIAYLKASDEEVYKIDESGASQLYVCDTAVSAAFPYQGSTVLVKQNGQLIMTEFEKSNTIILKLLL